jgi:hypothetical protein
LGAKRFSWEKPAHINREKKLLLLRMQLNSHKQLQHPKKLSPQRKKAKTTTPRR